MSTTASKAITIRSTDSLSNYGSISNTDLSIQSAARQTISTSQNVSSWDKAKQVVVIFGRTILSVALTAAGVGLTLLTIAMIAKTVAAGFIIILGIVAICCLYLGLSKFCKIVANLINNGTERQGLIDTQT